MSLTLDQPNMALDTPLPVADNAIAIGNQQPLGRWINRLFAILKGVGPQLRMVATLDFPNTLAGTTQVLTVSVPGAAVGQGVALGAPAPPANSSWGQPYVSAPGVVSVPFVNPSAGPINPGPGDFLIIVMT